MLNTEHLSIEAWQAAALSQGLAIPTEFCVSLIGTTEPDCDERLAGFFEGKASIARLRADWRALNAAYIAAGRLKVMPDLEDLLAFLRERSIPHIVATSSKHELAKAKLSAAGLEYLIDPIVTGDTVARGKPAADPFLAAAELLQVPPERCIVVEDSELGVQAALSAGMKVFLVPGFGAPSRPYDPRRVTVVQRLGVVLDWLRAA